jgi:hypothetical protein
MPEEQRPKLISHTRRQFLNTIRMTAYRAETALVAIIRQHLKRSDDAHALAKAISAVLQELNRAEIDFAATNIKIKYEMVSDPSPASQDLCN